MTEEFLHLRPINELLDQMIQSMDELIAMPKESGDVKAIEEKQKEIEMLQRVIVARRAEFPPLK